MTRPTPGAPGAPCVHDARCVHLALRLAFAALACSASACGPSEERASEVQLHEAIDRLRTDQANGPERRLKLVAVEQLPALTAAARAARDACVPAYRDLLDAEDAISLAEQRVKQAAILKLLPADALTELAAAEVLLKKARDEMPACDAAAAKLALSAR